MAAEGAGFSIDVNENIDTAVLQMSGFVDADTVPIFEKHLNAVKNKGVKNIVLDFSNLTHLSSQGVSILVQKAIEINETGSKIQAVGLSDRVSLIFEELKISRFFT